MIGIKIMVGGLLLYCVGFFVYLWRARGTEKRRGLILSLLKEHGEMPETDLLERCGGALKRATLSPLLSTLEDDGMVVSRNDHRYPGKRRLYRLAGTETAEQGRARLEREAMARDEREARRWNEERGRNPDPLGLRAFGGVDPVQRLRESPAPRSTPIAPARVVAEPTRQVARGPYVSHDGYAERRRREDDEERARRQREEDEERARRQRDDTFDLVSSAVEALVHHDDHHHHHHHHDSSPSDCGSSSVFDSGSSSSPDSSSDSGGSDWGGGGGDFGGGGASDDW